MPYYQCSLSRSWTVKVEAESKEAASHLAEFYIGYSDDSTEEEKAKEHFRFGEIEMQMNDVIEVEETSPF